MVNLLDVDEMVGISRVSVLGHSVLLRSIGARSVSSFKFHVSILLQQSESEKMVVWMGAAVSGKEEEQRIRERG